MGGEEKKLFPVSSSFAAGNLGAQEDFRCSTFPALFELSWGGELERKKVVVGGCVCAPSVSRGRAQVPGDVAVAPLLSQVHGMPSPTLPVVAWNALVPRSECQAPGECEPQ